MLISRYQNFLIKEDDDMDLLGFRRILDSTPFAVLAVAFGVLFVVFLVKYIQRGSRITELERMIKERDPELFSQLYPLYRAPVQQPDQQTAQQVYQPVQKPVVQPVQQPVQQAQQPIYQPVQQPVQQAQQPVYQPVQQQVQQPVQQRVKQAAAATYVHTPAVQTPVVSAPVTALVSAPVSAPKAVPAPAPAAAPATTYQSTAVAAQKPKREKFFSSINITFGIGVLLLTMVGATFMTGSWEWMSDAVRVIGLIAIVVMIYGMSLFAGKGLKLQQTGFALYTLASLLGPIVVIGMGVYELFGSSFSFSNGKGWIVASVASFVLLLSSIGGRFIFKEKGKVNVYRTTTYIALTWLVVFLSAMAGQASPEVSEWTAICLGLATLALMLRIASLIPLFREEIFFRVYAEVMTYVPAILLLFTIAFADVAIVAGTVVEFIALVLFAKFAKGRGWVKYITPVMGFLMEISLIIFMDSDNMVLVTSVMMALTVLLFVIHKILKISSWASDTVLPIVLNTIAAIMSIEDCPIMGVISCFLLIVLFVFRMTAEPAFASKENKFAKFFRKEVSVTEQVFMAVLTTIYYYIGVIMLYFVPEDNPVSGNIYFPVMALIPAVIILIFRFATKDDLRLKLIGLIMAGLSLVSGFFSIFAYTTGMILCKDLYFCAWLLTFAFILFAVSFNVGALKKKNFGIGQMAWLSACINSFAIGVFLMIEFNAQQEWGLEFIPEDYVELTRQIAVLTFLVINVAVVAVAFFKRKLENENITAIKYFSLAFSMIWFICAGFLIGPNWQLFAIAVIFAVILALFKAEFFTIAPVFAAELALISEVTKIGSDDLNNVLMIVLALAVAGLGRLLFRKTMFSVKGVDYLTLTSWFFLFGTRFEDYMPMAFCFTIAILIMNIAGRVKVPFRVILTFATVFCCIGILAQPYLEYPEVIAFEINLALILGTLLLICKVIKPFPAECAKYIWFTGVSVALVAEGISAAVTGEGTDLIIVGTAAIGIFIFSFIRRLRLWFILGIVAMVSIAIYLSVVFWATLVWLIYLLVSGSILIVMASVNEWGKRHNKDGKKRRFFEEWKW